MTIWWEERGLANKVSMFHFVALKEIYSTEYLDPVKDQGSLNEGVFSIDS